MVKIRIFSAARQLQAIHTVPEKPLQFFCFILAHELHSLTHSLTQAEKHTGGKDTFSIIHSALNFISFPLKSKHSRSLHRTDVQRAKVSACMSTLGAENTTRQWEFTH